MGGKKREYIKVPKTDLFFLSNDFADDLQQKTRFKVIKHKYLNIDYPSIATKISIFSVKDKNKHADEKEIKKLFDDWNKEIGIFSED